MVKTKCLFCKNIFLIHTWKIKQNKGKFCSQKCWWTARKGKESVLKGRFNPKVGGSNHWNWKGGVSSNNKIIRTSAIYLNNRDEVFKRDNYVCRICGKVGGKMAVDHIRPFSIYPKYRLDKNNLRVLCEDCHKLKTKLDIKFINGLYNKSLLERVTYYVEK